MTTVIRVSLCASGKACILIEPRPNQRTFYESALGEAGFTVTSVPQIWLVQVSHDSEVTALGKESGAQFWTIWHLMKAWMPGLAW